MVNCAVVAFHLGSLQQFLGQVCGTSSSIPDGFERWQATVFRFGKYRRGPYAWFAFKRLGWGVIASPGLLDWFWKWRKFSLCLCEFISQQPEHPRTSNHLCCLPLVKTKQSTQNSNFFEGWKVKRISNWWKWVKIEPKNYPKLQQTHLAMSIFIKWTYKKFDWIAEEQ